MQRAREAIEALDAAIDTVAAQRADVVGRVRISTGHAIGRRYLLPLLPELLRRHPGLAPELEFDDRRVDLVRDGFDLALRGGQLTDSSLVSRHICELRTVLVAAPAYLAHFGVPKKVDELARHRLIAVRFLSGQTSPWRFKDANGTVQERAPESAALVVSDPQAAVEAAVLGLGITQAGLHQAWDHLRNGQLKVVLARRHHSGNRTLALQYPHRSLVAPRVRATVDFLLEEFQRIEALHVSWEQVRAYAA